MCLTRMIGMCCAGIAQVNGGWWSPAVVANTDLSAVSYQACECRADQPAIQMHVTELHDR